MSNEIVFKGNAIQSIQAFTNRPDLYDQREIEYVVRRSLTLATRNLIGVQKIALSFRTRYKLGKRGDRREVREEWNRNPAMRYLGPAPKKSSNYKTVHRRLRKLVDRLEKTKVTVRPASGSGSGTCSETAGKAAYAGRLTGGGNINICPKFFVAGKATDAPSLADRLEGNARQSGILVHELCHTLGVFGKGHKEVHSGQTDEMLRAMRTWADNNGKKARANADSYEAMVTSLIIEEGLLE